MTIKYEINFFDYWHLSSGLSGGVALDNYVIKDDKNLPYMSGKTIKGLVREMAEKFVTAKDVQTCFGKVSDKDNSDDTTLGSCFFSNATLLVDEASELVWHNLTNSLYEVIAATKIDENGIAVDGSLRYIEVVVPVSLYGYIQAPDEFSNTIKKCLKMIKRVGLNRNRGLGRCEFVVKD